MAAFPSLTPTERTLSLGEVPIKTYRSLNGAVVRRAFGNLRFNYELTLAFGNIKEKDVSLIWDHYLDNLNALNGFDLPATIFAGYNTNATIGRNEGLLSRIQALTAIKWYYTQPPQIESVYRDISTVQVQLSGNLNYSS
jgi:hypothetical protein